MSKRTLYKMNILTVFQPFLAQRFPWDGILGYFSFFKISIREPLFTPRKQAIWQIFQSRTILEVWFCYILRKCDVKEQLPHCSQVGFPDSARNKGGIEGHSSLSPLLSLSSFHFCPIKTLWKRDHLK